MNIALHSDALISTWRRIYITMATENFVHKNHHFQFSRMVPLHVLRLPPLYHKTSEATSSRKAPFTKTLQPLPEKKETISAVVAWFLYETDRLQHPSPSPSP